jgi:hypothetical protein
MRPPAGLIGGHGDCIMTWTPADPEEQAALDWCKRALPHLPWNEWRSTHDLREVGISFCVLDTLHQAGLIDCRIDPVLDQWGREAGSRHYWRGKPEYWQIETTPEA